MFIKGSAHWPNRPPILLESTSGDSSHFNENLENPTLYKLYLVGWRQIFKTSSCICITALSYFSSFSAVSQPGINVGISPIDCNNYLLSLVPSKKTFSGFPLCLPYSFRLLFILPDTLALSSQITGILVIGTDESYPQVNLEKCFCASACVCVQVCICLSEFIIGMNSPSHLWENRCCEHMFESVYLPEFVTV